MVRLSRIYTRGGDKGETSLGGGGRVAKHDLRISALGTVDEANAQVGRACLHASNEAGEMLARIQNDLFDLGADLARPEGGDANRDALRVSERQVARLETEIDALNAELEPLESFVLPGGTEAASQLHLARTVVRRAERLAAELAGREPLNPQILKYLNRLSDHLFVLSRHANGPPAGGLPWKPGANR